MTPEIIVAIGQCIAFSGLGLASVALAIALVCFGFKLFKEAS